jgi:hypothetical protein
MDFNEIWPTAEMPAWTGDEDAPRGKETWGVYTDLGAFQPKWAQPFVPVITRISHEGRHQPRLRWGQLRKWAANAKREAQEFLFGAFVPLVDAR